MATTSRARRSIAVCLVLIAFISLLHHFRAPFPTISTSSTMSVTHTVLFQFEAGADPERVKSVGLPPGGVEDEFVDKEYDGVLSNVSYRPASISCL